MGAVNAAPQFVVSVMASLDYWREQTRDLDDPAIARLDQDRHNLHRAVQFGLALPQAWEATAEIAIQAIPLVNRRMYREEWLQVFRRLLDQAPAESQWLRFWLLIQFGRLQRLQRRLDEAIAAHRAAQTLAAELGDAHALSIAYYNLGRDHLDRREYGEAERLSRLVLDMPVETQEADQALVAQAYNMLGQLFRAKGELDRSAQYLNQALAIDRAAGDPTRLARSLIELANDWRAAGRPDEAIATYLEASDLLAPTANELDKALIGINLGGAYFEKGEWTLAERTLRQANSPYLRQSGNLYYQAVVLTSLGNVLIKQERLAEAAAALRQAVALWRGLDDGLNLANALGALGEALAPLDAAEAAACFDEALSTLAQSPEEALTKTLRDAFQEERDKLARAQR